MELCDKARFVMSLDVFFFLEFSISFFFFKNSKFVKIKKKSFFCERTCPTDVKTSEILVLAVFLIQRYKCEALL